MKPNGLHRHSYLLILLAILPTCAVLLMTGCLLVFVPGIPETVLAVGIVLGFLCFVPGAMLAKLLQQNLIRNYEDARDLLLSRESGQVASASLSTLISRVFQDHNDRLSGLDQQCHDGKKPGSNHKGQRSLEIGQVLGLVPEGNGEKDDVGGFRGILVGHAFDRSTRLFGDLCRGLCRTAGVTSADHDPGASGSPAFGEAGAERSRSADYRDDR